MQALSSLVSSVIGDATTGVTDAERRATDARREVREALEKPPGALVDPGEVDRELRRVAPTLEAPPEQLLRARLPDEQADRYVEAWRPGHTAVRRGEVYLHPRFVGEEAATRFDALEAEFDVAVDPAELAFRGGLPFLTDAATRRIREGVARTVGCRRQETLAALADYGLPRPVVERMDVDVPLAFDGSLRAGPVDALGDGDVVPEAVGRVDARVQFESGEVR